MIEYYLLQFLTPLGAIFLAVGFLYAGAKTVQFIFGIGRNEKDATDDMKKRAGGDEDIDTMRLN